MSYLDAVQLIAVDHPGDVSIYTNDKFTGPPFPEFRLFGVRRRISPVAARDHRGRSVRARLLKRDGRYVNGFRRDMAGVAEPHTLDLDFPPGPPPMVARCWCCMAGSTGRTGARSSAEPRIRRRPRAAVSAGAGRGGQLADGDRGHGRPRRSPQDHRGRPHGKFRSGAAPRSDRDESRAYYWEEIFLSEETDPPEARLTPLAPESAELRFRGFSRAVVDPQRRKPETFVYEDVEPATRCGTRRRVSTRAMATCESFCSRSTTAS